MNFRNQLILLLPLLHSTSLFSGGIVATGSSIQSKQIHLSADYMQITDSEYVAQEKIKIEATQYIKGTGLFKGPEIVIKTKKFEFTGTISCDKSCLIITEQPFNHRQFKRVGRGSFKFKVQEMPDPVPVSVNGFDIVLLDKFEQNVAECFKQDDVAGLQKCIAAQQDLLKDTDRQTRLLLFSCIYQAYRCVEHICVIDGLINKEGPFQDSPLLLAVSMKDLRLVEVLIAGGADLNKKDMRSQGITPLIFAADRGYLDIVKALLAAGADRSISLTGPTWRAVDCARSNGHTTVVKYLNNPDLAKKEVAAQKSKQAPGGNTEDSAQNASNNAQVDTLPVAQVVQKVSMFQKILNWLGL